MIILDAIHGVTISWNKVNNTCSIMETNYTKCRMWLEYNSCDGGFKIMSDVDIISNLIQPEEQENEAESGEGEIINRINHNMAQNSVDTLLEKECFLQHFVLFI